MTKMATLPIYGKNFSRVFLKNQNVNYLETWYIIRYSEAVKFLQEYPF